VAAEAVVYEVGAEGDVPVLGGEVAAPGDDEVGMALFEGLAEGDGLLQLGAGHDGEGEDGPGATGTDAGIEDSKGIVFQVAVYDAIIVMVFEDGTDGEEGHGQNGFAVGGGLGVVEDYHRKKVIT
jgi:hypothetical protein